MKRLIPVFLLLLLGLCVSCGKKEQPKPEHESTTEYVIDAKTLLEDAAVAAHDCEIHGHVFSEATCQQKATCFYCGQQQGKLAAHDWTHATCIQKSTCTVCGITSGSFADHLYSAATCAGPASCVFCGKTVGSAKAHQFRAATCVSPSMCTVCMKKQGSALGHIWTGGSCTEGQVCTRCGRTSTAPGHKMQGGGCTEDAVCSVCGYTEKAKGHQYADGVCTVCGKTELQASQDELTRTTAPPSEPESTQPALDLQTLTSAGTELRALLQKAHDEADAAIYAESDAAWASAQAAADDLHALMSRLDDTIALCSEDARLKDAHTALQSVRRTIAESASVSSFYDSTFLKTLTKMRGDCTNGLKELEKFEKTIEQIQKNQ